MSIKLQLPELTDLKPRLVVIGVGGAGCNAVNNMVAAGLDGVEFVVANTDAQALAASSAEHRIQLGAKLTEGLGAGSKPDIGQAAAEEAIEDIRAQVTGAHMVFIAAGMGGGTGTGAAATIARVAKEMGILTVGVVTKPFQFEGSRRMRIAEAGIADLKLNVDTLIVIPNQNLFRLANEKTTFSEAFILADQVLYSGVACIVDLIIKEGLINLDFADVRTVISGMGSAMMGTGEASGEQRAIVAAEEAIANPLLDDVSLEGARGLLLSITGGSDLTLYEVDEAASRVRQEVDPDANIIVGATYDDSLGDRVRVSIVASGMRSMTNHEGVADWSTTAGIAGPNAGVTFADPTPPTPALFADQSSPVSAPESTAPQDQHQLVQQRLSEALQPAATANAGPPTEQMAPPPLTPASGTTWGGTGDVTIEDGLPPLADAHHAPQTAAEPPQTVGYSDSRPFEPALPEPMPRTGRRMPDVEDFPPHAQMEYHHKHAQHDESLPEHQTDSFAEPPRKLSLLDRLKRRARGKSDSLVDNVGSESEALAHPVSVANDSLDSGSEPVSDAHVEDQRETYQEADLPMFFGRVAR